MNPSGPPSSADTNGEHISEFEMAAMKNLIKKQQLKLELLKKHIEEVNLSQTDVYSHMQGLLSEKADQDQIVSFKKDMEEKVVGEMQKKIDKIELRRSQMLLRKKIEHLESKVGDITTGRSFLEQPGQPLMKTNNKCISCFREPEEG